MEIEIANLNDVKALTSVEIASKKQSIPNLVGDIEIDFDRRLQRRQNYFAGGAPSCRSSVLFEVKGAGHLAGHWTKKQEVAQPAADFVVEQLKKWIEE